MDNTPLYGIRWAREWNSSDTPPVVPRFVATAAAFNINNGAQGVGLGAGDPVISLSTGGVTLCDGSEGAGGALAVFGIVAGVKPYWNATKARMDFGEVLPSGTAWGTILERQSWVLVTPAEAGWWEIDVDDATTATTEAAYQAFVGENADHILSAAVGGTRALPKLDISSHATTATLIWRIEGVSKSMYNRDFAGANTKLIVRINRAQAPGFQNTTLTGTLGV